MKKLTAILSLSVFILISISSLVFAAETNMTQTTPAQTTQESQRAKRYSTEPPVHQYIAFLAYLISPDEIKNEMKDYIPTSSNSYFYQSDFSPSVGWTDTPDTFDPKNLNAVLIEGAWEEDIAPTPLRHFWDPDCGYNCGLNTYSGLESVSVQAACGLYPCDSALKIANEDRFWKAGSSVIQTV